MKHHAAPEFWLLFERLPARTQDQARRNYEILKSNPQIPHSASSELVVSGPFAFGRRFRALGVSTEDGVVWFWIGSHAEYDQLVS